MSNHAASFFVVTAMILTASGAQATSAGSVVVANRTGGTISVIDSATDVVSTTPLPAANAPSEPMYVFADPESGRFFVGDRANDRVVAYSSETFEPVGEVASGDGIFHMWGDPRSRQLWVVNDTARQITVIDMDKLEPITTIDGPADLEAFKLHDLVLDPSTGAAFVTMYDVEKNSADDWLLRYDGATYEETHRIAVGDDTHLVVSGADDDKLFALVQSAGEVQVFRRTDLSVMPPNVEAPAAHGAAVSADGDALYTTNIAGNGKNGLIAIDTADQSVIGSVDAPFPVPHNVAVSPDQTKVYVTHSGKSATRVSIYDVTARDRAPVLLGSVETDLNPYGIAAIPAQ